MSMKGIKTAIRGLGRAFRAKDEKAFDEALEELEEAVEEGKDEEPETIEVHNHIPDSMHDTSLGEMPPMNDRRHDDNEMPPWFKEHAEATDKRFKAMADSIEELKGDRRHRDESEPEERGEEDFMDDDEGNLEMMDRGHRDEPSEREEMAERIRERGGDKRHRDRRDEANKEILGELEFEAPPGTGDRARRARDSAFLEDAFQDATSKAEIIAPGLQLPTFDRAASPVKTAGAILKLRKTALDLAYNKPETRGVIENALSGRTFDSKRLSHGNARVLFNVVAQAAKDSNNNRATDHGRSVQTQRPAGITSLADINARNRKAAGRA